MPLLGLTLFKQAIFTFPFSLVMKLVGSAGNQIWNDRWVYFLSVGMCFYRKNARM